MEPTPRSLIIDLLSTLRRGAMPVRALVAAASLFGIPENNLRVALARLLRTGLVERDERGQYRLGARAAAVNRRVVAWRRSGERVHRWRGGWVAVHTAGLARGDRSALRRNERALRLTGFRAFDSGLELRPDNLAGGVAGQREVLLGLGLDPNALVARLSQLDTESEDRARSLWDAAAQVAETRAIRLEVERSAERLADLTRGDAMVESFLIGGRAVRCIVLDPLLPDVLVPDAERRALVEAMEYYDELGRAAWASFLAEYGVPHRAAPTNVRMAAEPLRAAGGRA